MAKQSQWVSAEANEAILQGIRGVIIQHLAGFYGPEQAETLYQAIETKGAEIERQQAAAWLKDEPSRFHLRFMALLMANYTILSELLGKDEALALLKRATIEPSRPFIQTGVKQALDAAPDPMTVLVEASKARETEFFGQTFVFERQQDDEQAYLLHVKRCFYHSFALAQGVPELMQILCEWDWSWAGAIEPEKHGFCFELPTTLGYGGDVCRFYFRQVGKL